MCGAPEQTATLPPGVDVTKETVLQGRALDGSGAGVGGAFVRLLDAGGEFTAEVVTSATGDFRFFAGPGTWRLSALHRSGKGSAVVDAKGPGVHSVELSLT
jgi:Protein of unknown function (DUF1416)